MAITYGTAAVATAVLSNTISVDIDAGSGANRVLFVGLGVSASRTFTDISYGGNAMTLVAQVGAGDQARLYKLVNPPTGTNTFTATHNGSNVQLRAAGLVVNGIDTTTPNDTAVTQAVVGTSADQSVNVTTETNDSVLSFAVVFHSSSSGTITSLNTTLADQDNVNMSIGMSHAEHASQVSMGWSFTGDGVGGASFWQVAVNLNIVGAVVEVTKTPTQGVLTLNGLAPSSNPFLNVRIREVLIGEFGQPIANATDIRLMVWYSGQCRGAPDVSINGQTTDANGTTSWSIATGTLIFAQEVFYVAQNSVSFSTYTAARMTPSYEL